MFIIIIIYNNLKLKVIVLDQKNIKIPKKRNYINILYNLYNMNINLIFKVE